MTLRNHCGLPVLVALGLLISACGGDDGGSEAASSETGTEAESGTSDEVGTEAGETAETTTTATTDADTTAETTDAETTDAETTDAETTDATTDTTDATDTTGNSACADIQDPDECAAMAGCQPVNGARVKVNGPDAPCLEPAEFIGCIPEQACGDALTWFCQGNGTYQVNDTCGPEGFDPCDGPVDPVSACP